MSADHDGVFPQSLASLVGTRLSVGIVLDVPAATVVLEALDAKKAIFVTLVSHVDIKFVGEPSDAGGNHLTEISEVRGSAVVHRLGLERVRDFRADPVDRRYAFTGTYHQPRNPTHYRITVLGFSWQRPPQATYEIVP